MFSCSSDKSIASLALFSDRSDLLAFRRRTVAGAEPLMAGDIEIPASTRGLVPPGAVGAHEPLRAIRSLLAASWSASVKVSDRCLAASKRIASASMLASRRR